VARKKKRVSRSPDFAKFPKIFALGFEFIGRQRCTMRERAATRRHVVYSHGARSTRRFTQFRLSTAMAQKNSGFRENAPTPCNVQIPRK
jgi:hypothetical protein